MEIRDDELPEVAAPVLGRSTINGGRRIDCSARGVRGMHRRAESCFKPFVSQAVILDAVIDCRHTRCRTMGLGVSKRHRMHNLSANGDARRRSPNGDDCPNERSAFLEDADVTRYIATSLQCQAKSHFDTIHHNHGLEVLYIWILIEELTCEPLIVFHVTGRDNQHEVGLAGDIIAVHDL
jgi:hypothetical protein